MKNRNGLSGTDSVDSSKTVVNSFYPGMVKQHKVERGSGILTSCIRRDISLQKRLSITRCHTLQIETNKQNIMDNNKSLPAVSILALIADSSNEQNRQH